MTNLAYDFNETVADRLLPIYHAHVINQDNAWLASAYYDALESDHLVEQSFSDGSISSKQDFVSMTDTNVLIIGTRNGAPASHVNLNGFHGRAAQAHFSVLRSFHGQVALDMAKTMIDALFQLKRQDGTPLIKQLIGITPVTNPLAVRFSQRIGYRKLAILKEAYPLKDGTLVDAHLTILEKPNG
jgi:hypothetical protein